MNKLELLKLYNLHQEIKRVERTIFNDEFIENWFVWFEKLRNCFWELYEEFEKQDEYTLVERLEDIVDEWLQLFEFSLLTDEDRKKQTRKYIQWWEEYESLSIFKHE